MSVAMAQNGQNGLFVKVVVRDAMYIVNSTSSKRTLAAGSVIAGFG